MYIISTLKANIMYTRVYNVRIGPSDVMHGRVSHIINTRTMQKDFTELLRPGLMQY